MCRIGEKNIPVAICGQLFSLFLKCLDSKMGPQNFVGDGNLASVKHHCRSWTPLLTVNIWYGTTRQRQHFYRFKRSFTIRTFRISCTLIVRTAWSFELLLIPTSVVKLKNFTLEKRAENLENESGALVSGFKIFLNTFLGGERLHHW